MPTFAMAQFSPAYQTSKYVILQKGKGGWCKGVSKGEVEDGNWGLCQVYYINCADMG